MGKVKKHTEYYCDVCGEKVKDFPIAHFNRHSSFYKVKAYTDEGKRHKHLGYDYVCNSCMNEIIKGIRIRKENKNDNTD